MKTITYNDYYNRVYGCFLGKCIGGTAGGPAEGRKELLDYPLDEAILHTALPNDDLDLQILWLEVMEEKGLYFTGRDLAQAFYDNVPYGPGEYAYFKKNFGRGIMPPTSGSFNNRFYKNGMGCPIRSEIWACICPGDPARTWHYVEMDGTMDHEHDSVLAEYFLAAAESMAFFRSADDSIAELLSDALTYLPADAKITQALRRTLQLAAEQRDWKWIRSDIIRRYGHPDCTNLYQNMCFTVLALLYGEGDMRKTIRLGCSMGYDTDCICATAASIIGILRGADRLLTEDGFTDTGIKAAVKLRRENGPIADLARDVARVGFTLFDAMPCDIRITDAPEFVPIPHDVPPTPPLTISVDYCGDPVLRIDEEKTVLLHLRTADRPMKGTLSFSTPPEICVSVSRRTLSLDENTVTDISMSFVIAPNSTRLAQSNRITVVFTGEDGTQYTETFGLNGADVWYCYGPFFGNNVDLTHISPYEPYGKHIPVPAGIPWEDPIRDYHLNRFADIHEAYLDESAFFADTSTSIPTDPTDARKEPELICICEDYFEAADLYSSTGPAVSYLYRLIESPEDRAVDVTVGCEGPFQLWINGVFVGEGQDVCGWTLENKHFYNIPFRRGINRILFKIANPTGRAGFSLIYRIPGTSWRQYEDFTSVLVDLP